MKIDYILIDFDETLFNHMAYMDWLDQELHRLGKLVNGRGSLNATVDNFHDVISDKPLIRLYRHNDHLLENTNSSWDDIEADIKQLAEQQKRDFCYGDSHQFIYWQAKQPGNKAILTFGHEDYQKFKIGLCRHLKDIRVLITKVPKADYINQNFKNVKGILIDDKYPLNLPAGWFHIWIDRQSDLDGPVKKDQAVIELSNLGQVPAAIDMIQGSSQ